jgi:DNA-directed RNA polymerase specialized sigma24 family protein
MSLSVDLTERDYERIEELIDLSARSGELARAMARLSRVEREALCARVVQGQPYHAVAIQLGCTEQAARTRVARGLRHLAAFLTTDPGATA